MERRELLGGRTFNGETGATWWEGAGGGESEGRRSYLHCSCNSPPPVHLSSPFLVFEISYSYALLLLTIFHILSIYDPGNRESPWSLRMILAADKDFL